jgi:adenylate cyclase
MIGKILDFLYNRVFLNSRSQRVFIISLAIVLLLIIVLLPVGQWLDNTFYDLFLTRIKRPIEQHDSLMLVDIDDNAMNQVPFRWPWPRSKHGDALEVFAEFGTRGVVFDIEFLGPSPEGVNPDAGMVYEQNLADTFTQIMNYTMQVSDAFINSAEQRRDPGPIKESITSLLMQKYETTLFDYDQLTFDNDAYLAQRIRFFGNAYGTVNMLMDENLATEDRYIKIEEQSRLNLEQLGIPKSSLLPDGKDHPGIKYANITEFPEQIILNEYRSIGYTKVFRDSDAAIRAIPLFMQKDGYVIPQLAFGPFLDIFDVSTDQIDLRNRNRIILRDVLIDGKKRNIRIPLDKNHMMRINWPSGRFDEIFPFNKKAVADGKEEPQHFSYYNLINYKDNIVGIFEANLAGFADFYDEDPERQFYDEYYRLKDFKENMISQSIFSGLQREEYLKAYENYFNRLLSYISDEAIADWERRKRNGAKAAGAFDDSALTDIFGEVRRIKIGIRDSIDLLLNTRKFMFDNLEGKICFVGYTATGTVDIGSNPFDNAFENVGTHPSIFNTILQQDFITMFPKWIAVILTILLFAALVWIVSKRSAATMAVAGFGSTILVIIGLTLIFRFTNLYISPVPPLFYGLFISVIMIIIKYILNEKEKSQIRNTFNRYLSPVVITEILKNPKEVELGGERRNCTAIFTDVQGFSSISEKFMDDPKSLVSLLNEYLTAMTDIILENGGTIDKYEGDAIIGFFGAPLDMVDHPYRACLSSLRMKQAEDALNQRILQEGQVESPLLTRIGINTGDMFVGNIGTQNRLDYTMMGHSVNLAARLEGVNKQYGTYQLISEYTNELVKDQILTRKLDRVRVVNINTPIRLYELIALKSEATANMNETISLFHQGLEKFEEQDWKASLELFQQVKHKTVGDAPTDLYIDRCTKFLKKPPKAGWDGVYTLSVK